MNASEQADNPDAANSSGEALLPPDLEQKFLKCYVLQAELSRHLLDGFALLLKGEAARA
jgi:hypothetical protein